GSPCFTSLHFHSAPSPTTQCPAEVAFAWSSALRLTSRLRHSLAGSPGTSGRIEFVILRIGALPRVALHPASRRRSYGRLMTLTKGPYRDLHPASEVRLQAHEGERLARNSLQKSGSFGNDCGQDAHPPFYAAPFL